VQVGNRNHHDLVFDDSVYDAIGKSVQTVAPDPIRKRLPSVPTFQDPALADSDFSEKALIEIVSDCAAYHAMASSSSATAGSSRRILT